MKPLKILAIMMLAGSVLPTEALSQDRRTLFDVLFQNAQQRKLDRQRARLQAQQPAKLPRVKTSRNYAYRVVENAPIRIKPLPVEFAALNIGAAVGASSIDGIQPQEEVKTPQASQMTKDIALSEGLNLKAEKHLAKAVSDYYSEKQNYIWLNENGEWNARARSTMRVLEKANEHGLRNSDYEVKISKSVDETEAVDPAIERLHKEIGMSVAVLRYAMDAEFGAINPNRLSGYHDFPVHYEQSSSLFEKIVSKGLPANTLKTFHPSHDKYAALREELAGLSNVEDDVIELPRKVLIKPGMSNESLKDFVAAIRKRGSKELLEAHSEFLSAYTGDPVYTKEAVALVKAYQKEAGLGADGIIGQNTSASLAGLKSEDRIMQVKLAMERLRWLPNDLGSRHVFINQPEYVARYINGGNEELSMRVVVGKRSNQTNFFYDKIEHVVYNPYWGVPRSIIVNEFLPKSLGNPGYLDSLGYEVTHRGRRVSSTSINWATVGANPNFGVRQPPGKRNALGELKIMFPNKHSIYMHDTPSKHLFKRQHRAFSHGCVRLHDPKAMAAAVLGKTKGHVKSMISTGKNQTEKLSVNVPVYVAYFTAWPQADGTVKYFRDMYGRDKHLEKAFEITRKSRVSNVSL